MLHPRASILVCCVWLSIGAAACGSGDGKNQATDAGAGNTDSGPAQLAELTGTFTIRYLPAVAGTSDTAAAPAHTSLLAQLKDGPVPAPIAWMESDRVGDCALFLPSAPFCDPACGGSAVCVSDGMCVDQPHAKTVGTLHVSGLGASALAIEPIADNYQLPSGTKLPYPPCSEGDPIKLDAEGGSYPAFSLQASCIAPLTLAGTLRVETGKPLKLSWPAPADPTQARITVSLNLSHHGGSTGKIDCDAPDIGTLEIAQSLITKLVALGFSGAPSISVTRSVVAHATNTEPAGVTLIVASQVDQVVEIPGLVSCTTDQDCPPGQTCQTDLKCQ